jgi:sporulation protein YlmC with PRC-barrel domain
MLKLNNTLLNKPIISLRTGHKIAITKEAILNPHNLKIEGFYCDVLGDKKTQILLFQDIREINRKGFVVNDHDSLSDHEDLIRLKEIIEIDYSIIGKPVVTTSGEKIGKVTEYSVDIDSLFIQKLHITKPILKNITGGHLIIDRTQVNEITPKKIIINDLLQGSAIKASVTA